MCEALWSLKVWSLNDDCLRRLLAVLNGLVLRPAEGVGSDGRDRDMSLGAFFCSLFEPRPSALLMVSRWGVMGRCRQAWVSSFYSPLETTSSDRKTSCTLDGIVYMLLPFAFMRNSSVLLRPAGTCAVS